MLPTKESLRVEFKSEVQRPQTDDEIIANVVALANTQGGTLYLGIEDDGTVTGASRTHININGLAAFIFNKTVPQVTARVELLRRNGLPVVSIEVDNSQQIVSTSSGRTLQRRIKADGTPEVVPLFVSQFISRLSQQRNYDYSAQPAPEATLADLDPDARNLLREHIQQTNAKSTLLLFDDEEFDRAMELVTSTPSGPQPTIAGILTIGTDAAIKRSVPTASAVFQVMRAGSPRVNTNPFTLPLVTMFDRINELLTPWNPNHEIMSGLIHVNIPDFDHQAIREAMVNAFCHRDYAQMGSVRFLIDDEGLTISNPGGFIDGVTESNLLTAQPRSRNPQLALVLKTAGYAERTGRGVDKIYSGTISSGGVMPDYSESTSNEVVLFLRRIIPDEEFTGMIASEERRRGAALPIWSLIVLSLLREHRRLTLRQLCDFSHVEQRRIVGAVEDLVEAGLVQATGNGATRSYTLGPRTGGGKGTAAAGDNPALKGVSAGVLMDAPGVNRADAVVKLANVNGGTVTTSQVMAALGVSYISAYRLLKKMESAGTLRHEGNGPSSRYELV